MPSAVRDDLRLERTEGRQAAMIGCDLLAEIAHQAHLPLLSQKLRGAPIDAIPIIGRDVRKVIGETGDEREFVAGLLIEIGVTAPASNAPCPLPMFAKLAEL